jgi:hypothetical protein
MLAPLVSPEWAWKEEVIPLSETELTARIEASQQYRSQTAQLFDDAEKMVTFIRRHVASAGGERLWHRVGSVNGAGI